MHRMELSKADAKNVVLFIFSLRDTIRSISFAHNVGIVNRQMMMIYVIEWVVFLLLEAYLLHREKRKMFLYELWMEHR